MIKWLMVTDKQMDVCIQFCSANISTGMTGYHSCSDMALMPQSQGAKAVQDESLAGMLQYWQSAWHACFKDFICTFFLRAMAGYYSYSLYSYRWLCHLLWLVRRTSTYNTNSISIDRMSKTDWNHTIEAFLLSLELGPPVHFNSCVLNRIVLLCILIRDIWTSA